MDEDEMSASELVKRNRQNNLGQEMEVETDKSGYADEFMHWNNSQSS